MPHGYCGWPKRPEIWPIDWAYPPAPAYFSRLDGTPTPTRECRCGAALQNEADAHEGNTLRVTPVSANAMPVRVFERFDALSQLKHTWAMATPGAHVQFVGPHKFRPRRTPRSVSVPRGLRFLSAIARKGNKSVGGDVSPDSGTASPVPIWGSPILF